MTLKKRGEQSTRRDEDAVQICNKAVQEAGRQGGSTTVEQGQPRSQGISRCIGALIGMIIFMMLIGDYLLHPMLSYFMTLCVLVSSLSILLYLFVYETRKRKAVTICDDIQCSDTGFKGWYRIASQIIHLWTITYLILLTFLLLTSKTTGQRSVSRWVLGNDTPVEFQASDSVSSEINDVFAGTVDLSCEVSLRTLGIQLHKMWFYSHILGWFAKMCIFRDWFFCIILSFTFEAIELSFQEFIPELKECWWDSLFLDVLVSNTIGMIIGYKVLRWCRAPLYHWFDPSLESSFYPAHSTLYASRSTEKNDPLQSERNCLTAAPQYPQETSRFRAFYSSRSTLQWRFFQTPTRLFWATALISELNVFLLMYALNIPASHTFHKFRVTLLCCLALNGVAEIYNNMYKVTDQLNARHGTNRDSLSGGHSGQLYFLTIFMETLVIFRYGAARFHRIVPKASVYIPWMISFGFLVMWSLFHFFVVGAERLNISRVDWTVLISNLETSVYGTLSGPASGNNPCECLFPLRKKKKRGEEKEKQTNQEKKKADEMEMDFVSATTTNTPGNAHPFWKRRYEWGRVWTLGVYVTSLPPLLCFCPLVVLVQNYDYD